MYRCVTATVEGFVQQIAVNLLPHGYRFYVTGEIPTHKDPAVVDAKLIDRYGIDVSKWIRARRKKQGIARLQYLRHGHFFLLIATEGKHPFFTTETTFRDLRRSPLQCFGYSVGCYQRPSGKWHPSVRIAKKQLGVLQKQLDQIALRTSPEQLREKIRSLPFAPFAPVRAQIFTLLRNVNQRRKRASLPLVGADCVRRRRKPVLVFAPAILR